MTWAIFLRAYGSEIKKYNKLNSSITWVKRKAIPFIAQFVRLLTQSSVVISYKKILNTEKLTCIHSDMHETFPLRKISQSMKQ